MFVESVTTAALLLLTQNAQLQEQHSETNTLVWNYLIDFEERMDLDSLNVITDNFNSLVQNKYKSNVQP